MAAASLVLDLRVMEALALIRMSDRTDRMCRLSIVVLGRC